MNKTNAIKPQAPMTSSEMPARTSSARRSSAVNWPQQLTPRQRLLKEAADKVLRR